MRILLLLLLLLSTFVNAKDVILEWNAPTLREDGTTITSIDGYKITHSIDNIAQPVIQIDDGSILTYTIVGASIGIHVFTIAAVENGFDGLYSNPVSAGIGISPIDKIEITVRVVE